MIIGEAIDQLLQFHHATLARESL